MHDSGNQLAIGARTRVSTKAIRQAGSSWKAKFRTAINIAAASADGRNAPAGILYLRIAAAVDWGTRDMVGQAEWGKLVSCWMGCGAPIVRRIAPRAASSLERLWSVWMWERAGRKAASSGRNRHRVLGCMVNFGMTGSGERVYKGHMIGKYLLQCR